MDKTELEFIAASFGVIMNNTMLVRVVCCNNGMISRWVNGQSISDMNTDFPSTEILLQVALWPLQCHKHRNEPGAGSRFAQKTALHLLHISANQHTLIASAAYGCSFGVKHYE
jgi:hypothetical protein